MKQEDLDWLHLFAAEQADIHLTLSQRMAACENQDSLKARLLAEKLNLLQPLIKATQNLMLCDVNPSIWGRVVYEWRILKLALASYEAKVKVKPNSVDCSFLLSDID